MVLFLLCFHMCEEDRDENKRKVRAAMGVSLRLSLPPPSLSLCLCVRVCVCVCASPRSGILLTSSATSRPSVHLVPALG